MDGFDYSAPAELFTMRSRKGSRPMGYRRFSKAAEAIRFAIEELQPEILMGAQLEVEEIRLRWNASIVRERRVSFRSTRCGPRQMNMSRPGT